MPINGRCLCEAPLDWHPLNNRRINSVVADSSAFIVSLKISDLCCKVKKIISVSSDVLHNIV